MAKVELVNILDLFGKEFSVPSYQRGYRWTTRQVEDLLEDILDFQKKLNKQPGEFYCLQPLVVKKLNQTEEKTKEKYEVIDGQQRLTTLYLILLYFKRRIDEDFNKKQEDWYRITYETRSGVQKFINSLENEINNKNDIQNIDDFYILEAWKFIKEWIDKRKGKELNVSDYLNTLLKVDVGRDDNKDIANNIRFIWYEIDESENISGREIFTRINMGKIPLTNAELIKALFFINEKEINEKEEDRIKHQFAKAYEWENIEKSLQNDDFWYFLNKEENSTPTRIEFIFELIADKYKSRVNINVNKSIDKYYAFYIFNELIRSRIDIKGRSGKISEETIREDLWDEVKSYFRMFEEWFNHNEYYHLIGYLIHCGEKIENIIKIYTKSTKEGFSNELKNKIKTYLQYSEYNYKKEIEDLNYNYEKDKKTIMNILLLCNIILTMKSQYSKFPFALFVKENWSIEHIHAKNSEEIVKDKDRKELLKSQIQWLEKNNEKELLKEIIQIFNQNNIEELKNILANDAALDEKLFKDLFKDSQDKIFEHYSSENFEDIHSIDNLALLSTIDNSTLGNNIFPVKREKIIKLDSEGRFIPIATKNVFLKYFSKESESNIKWTQEDREQYLNEISRLITEFFNNDNGE